MNELGVSILFPNRAPVIIIILAITSLLQPPHLPPPIKSPPKPRLPQSPNPLSTLIARSAHTHKNWPQML